MQKAPAPHWDESFTSVVPPKFAEKLCALCTSDNGEANRLSLNSNSQANQADAMQGSLQPMAAPLYPVRNPLFSRSTSFFLHDYNMKRRNVKEFWWFLLICSKFQPSPFLSSSQVSLEASNSFRTACGGRSSRRYFCPATKVPKNAFIHRLKVAASGHSTNAPRATKPMGKRLPKVEGYIETTDTTVDVRAGFACAVFSSAGYALLHWEFILVRYLVETPAFPWKSGHRPPAYTAQATFPPPFSAVTSYSM